MVTEGYPCKGGCGAMLTQADAWCATCADANTMIDPKQPEDDDN